MGDPIAGSVTQAVPHPTAASSDDSNPGELNGGSAASLPKITPGIAGGPAVSTLPPVPQSQPEAKAGTGAQSHWSTFIEAMHERMRGIEAGTVSGDPVTLGQDFAVYNVIDGVNNLVSMSYEDWTDVLQNIKLEDLNPGKLVEASAMKTAEEIAPAFLSQDPYERDIAKGKLIQNAAFAVTMEMAGTVPGLTLARPRASAFVPDGVHMRHMTGEFDPLPGHISRDQPALNRNRFDAEKLIYSSESEQLSASNWTRVALGADDIPNQHLLKPDSDAITLNDLPEDLSLAARSWRDRANYQPPEHIFDVISESKRIPSSYRPHIYGLSRNHSTGRIWVSDVEVTARDIDALISGDLKDAREVVVLTGVHGNPNGTIGAAERVFYRQDIASAADAVGDGVHAAGTVTVIDIANFTEEQLTYLVRRYADVDLVIGACHSSTLDFVLNGLDAPILPNFSVTGAGRLP